MIPLITTILPAGITDASVFLNFGFAVTVILMFPAEWISILDPIAVIAIVPHYRRFVTGTLMKMSVAPTSKQDVTAVNNNNIRTENSGTCPRQGNSLPPTAVEYLRPLSNCSSN